MDFTKLEAADTTTVHIEGLDGEPLYETVDDRKEPVTITVYGPGTKQYLRAQADVQNLFMKRLQAKGTKSKETADERLAREAEFLSACYAGSTHVSLGTELVKTKDQIKQIFMNPKLGFIMKQVNDKQGDWANFTKDSLNG